MTKIAMAYDFDGTLAEGNLPEHGLLQDLDIDKSTFWKEVKELTRKNDCDEVLAYMYLLIEKSNERNIDLTKGLLNSYSHNVPLFRGVETWFQRINEFAKEHDIEVEHFVISSGLYEIIETCEIAKEFKFIFASKYLYNKQGRATSPSVAINYTTKTQYLFRINKGIYNYFDNEKVNKWVPMDKRTFPFNRIIYFGDGDTDIPTMKMTRSQGGYSIAVFDPKRWNDPTQQNKIYKLIAEDRTQYVTPADYSDGSQLDIVVKGIVGRIQNEST